MFSIISPSSPAVHPGQQDLHRHVQLEGVGEEDGQGHHHLDEEVGEEDCQGHHHLGQEVGEEDGQGHAHLDQGGQQLAHWQVEGDASRHPLPELEVAEEAHGHIEAGDEPHRGVQDAVPAAHGAGARHLVLQGQDDTWGRSDRLIYMD